MKKSIFLTFVLAVGFAATFLTTSCGDDAATADCYSFAVTDTGGHSVWLGPVKAPLNLIHDSLVGTVSGSTVTISSQALGRDLTGTIDASDCNKVTLDSVRFPVGDTLKIATTLPIPGGFVKIWGIRAGGSGTINSSGAVSTSIKIASGNTNLTAPLDLSTITPGMKLELKGSFIKFQ